MKAVLSVYDKMGLVELARKLHAAGVALVSTGGTHRSLSQEGGIPVQQVSDLTGFPEILDGRVKTLHPAIHGGVLARRDDPGHMEEMARQGLETIDLVVVNLYPFVETVSKPRGDPGGRPGEHRHRRAHPPPGRRQELPLRDGGRRPLGLRLGGRGHRRGGPVPRGAPGPGPKGLRACVPLRHRRRPVPLGGRPRGSTGRAPRGAGALLSEAPAAQVRGEPPTRRARCTSRSRTTAGSPTPSSSTVGSSPSTT